MVKWWLTFELQKRWRPEQPTQNFEVFVFLASLNEYEVFYEVKGPEEIEILEEFILNKYIITLLLFFEISDFSLSICTC